MIKRFNELELIKQIAILMLCLINLYGIICLRYCDNNRQKLAAEIAAESGNTATEQEAPINRVELLRATYPDDWEPQYVYSEPGHTYYPEVLERIAKEQERAKQNAFERYLADREMRK